MKSRILVVVLCLVALHSYAQDQFQAFVKEAQDYYTQKSYKQAMLSLQDAINELNTLMAGDLGKSLPTEINGLKSVSEGTDGSAGGMIGGGMTITRRYEHPSKKENTADVNIIANSPMIQAMAMYINNPAMMGQGYKSVRVGTQRAILKSEMEDSYDDNGTATKQIRSTEIQIPLTSTMITLNLKGFAAETDELAFANKLGIDKIKTALGE
jgi:hypothetical protein